MRLTTLFTLIGCGTALVGFSGCGGGVSLGTIDSNDSNLRADAGSAGEGGTPAIDGGTITPDCTVKGACGPALGMPAIQCSDGSTGGNTGRCILQGSTCGWEIRSCPSPTPPPTCFDQNKLPDPAFKTCNTPADCIVVTYVQSCCGTMYAAGINKAQQANFETCKTNYENSLPACACASGPTGADDGSTDPNFTTSTASVACIANKCITSYDTGPCAGVTLPACPRTCANFPESGSCTAGDKCRMAGSTIGDECTCTSGTWACAVHPPLGPGCNSVCR